MNKGLSNNARTAIGYFCIALVFVSWFVMIGWIGSPQEFTFKIEMDNNTRDAVESINYSTIFNQADKNASLNYDYNFNNDNMEASLKGCVPARCDCTDWGCLAMCYECVLMNCTVAGNKTNCIDYHSGDDCDAEVLEDER